VVMSWGTTWPRPSEAAQDFAARTHAGQTARGQTPSDVGERSGGLRKLAHVADDRPVDVHLVGHRDHARRRASD
jgi:hypothetical protein